jgi:predicted dehydrogenase
MRRFRIAIIGCGNISRMHLAGYAKHPERVELAAACDILPGRAEAVCEKHGAGAAFASVKEALAGADWDVAVVCTPTPVREEVIRPLAEAGKHVFVEKPMADNIAEARRMADLCGRAGVKLAVNQTFRYHWGFDIARRAIAAGRIGRPLVVDQRDQIFRQDRGWRLACRRHVISVMGVHWLDGFRWLSGAEGTKVSARTHSSPAIECLGETDAVAQIAFDNGMTVSYVQSFSCRGGRIETVIVGEEGVLTLERGVVLYRHDGGREPAERWENPLAGDGKPETAFLLLNELLTAIEDDLVPPNGCVDNLKTISLLEAAYRSAGKDGAPVALEGGLIE